MCFVDWRRLGLPGTPSGTPAPTCCGICCRQAPAANPVTFRANGPATNTEPLRSPTNPASRADSPKKRGTEEHPWRRTTQTCVIHFTYRLPDNSPSLGVETQSCPTDTPIVGQISPRCPSFPQIRGASSRKAVAARTRSAEITRRVRPRPRADKKVANRPSISARADTSISNTIQLLAVLSSFSISCSLLVP